jgi:NAD(P)-dependent dehydrogenase (short-subunit alcohol dehydrogenase family)
VCPGVARSQTGFGGDRSVLLVAVALTCERLGASTLVIPTDVTDLQACSAMIQQAISKFSRIDGLINNAGMSMWSTVEDVQDVRFFQEVMAVNFFWQRVLYKIGFAVLEGNSRPDCGDLQCCAFDGGACSFGLLCQ